MAGFSIKIVSLIAVLVMVYIFVFPVNAEAAKVNTGAEMWSLDSKNDKDAKKLPAGVSQMETNYGPGDNGQSGKVTIAAGKSYIWISDKIVENSITISSGAWILQIITDSDWGTKGNKCLMEIGEWDGKFKSLTLPPQTIKNKYYPKLIIETLFQTESLSIEGNKHLALRITNLETTHSHIVYTGEGDYCSYLRSPETYTTTPLPELSSGILLTIGLAGLAAFVIVKRKSIV
jgi:hypothetical protein